jgi:cbb3-type cytochrome oxidase maturation protein
MGLEALYLLIPVSVLLAAVALALFLWAMLTGQFDDLETPPLRILFEEEPPPDRNARLAAAQGGRDSAPPSAAAERLREAPTAQCEAQTAQSAEERAASSAVPPNRRREV